MQARNAASVLPEPVGAEISVVRPPRMCGQPSSCGSVGVPNLLVNHSATRGWAQERGDISLFYSEAGGFANCSPALDKLWGAHADRLEYQAELLSSQWFLAY